MCRNSRPTLGIKYKAIRTVPVSNKIRKLVEQEGTYFHEDESTFARTDYLLRAKGLPRAEETSLPQPEKTKPITGMHGTPPHTSPLSIAHLFTYPMWSICVCGFGGFNQGIHLSFQFCDCCFLSLVAELFFLFPPFKEANMKVSTQASPGPVGSPDRRSLFACTALKETLPVPSAPCSRFPAAGSRSPPPPIKSAFNCFNPKTYKVH